MNSARPVMLLLALLACGGAHASPSTDALGTCLSDHTTGKDRKDLAKWIYVGMSAHPEIQSIARASAEATERAQRAVGAMVTRLVSEACPQEMRQVIRDHGVDGIKAPFEYLGKVAMQELMSDPKVNETISGFERYVDRSKVEPVVNAK